MSDDSVDLIVRVLVLYDAVPLLLFVLIYQFRVRWWRTSIGRLLMTFLGSLEAILLLTVLSLFWPDMPGRPYIRIGVWTLIGIVFTWFLIGFLRANTYRKEFDED